MAAPANANPPMTESKSARKKKAKAEALAGSSTPDKSRSGSIAGLEGEIKGEGASTAGSDYIRELQKQVRNLTKKIAATSRVDAIISENPNKSLDELVASKLINNDQKAQILKKPGLETQKSQLEASIVEYKKLDDWYQEAALKKQDQLDVSHAQALEEQKEAVEKEVRAQMEKEFRLQLLTFGRFLKAAAARRQQEDENLDLEGRAFEGALSNVYTGDASAVAAIESIVNGSSAKITDYTGELDVTYARIKELTLQEAPVEDEDPFSSSPPQPTASEEKEEVEQATSGADLPSYPTDPTVANAGLTEIDTDAATTLTNGHTEIDTPASTIEGTGAAGNAAAEEQWDTKAAGESAPGMEDSFEMIPRPADEVEKAGPPANSQSWADEAAEATATNGNDGFHEVVHHGHRGRGRGGFRGDFRGGEFRGRGRGGFRGRGGGERGEFRGGRGGRGRGGPRGGPPRAD